MEVRRAHVNQMKCRWKHARVDNLNAKNQHNEQLLIDATSTSTTPIFSILLDATLTLEWKRTKNFDKCLKYVIAYDREPFDIYINK